MKYSVQEKKKMVFGVYVHYTYMECSLSIYIKREIENITFKISRINIIFKCRWNILQDKSQAKPQNKSW